MLDDKLAYIFLLLLNVSPIGTAPAPPSAHTNSGTTLIQLNNLTPAFRNATSSLSSTFCSLPLTNSDVKTHTFAVPGTTTILVINYCPTLPIPRTIVGDTIATALIHMSDQLHIHAADTPLLSGDDPYSTPVVANCALVMNSQRTPGTQVIPQHLTYGVAVNALQGLFRFLYEEGNTYSAVIEVLDPGLTGSFVRVGVVSVRVLE